MTSQNNQMYERTASDVSSMITYAKLNENNLTPVTQALYFPNYETTAADEKFVLLELNANILTHIKNKQTLCFKGGLNEKLVLVTDDKTYDIKEAEISNSLLLIPDLKFAQQTSVSPLKSPKGNVNNRSLEKNADSSMEEDSLPVRQLENRQVQRQFHEYFECREINPRFRKMANILQMTRYFGPENEYCIDKNLLFTFDQLLDTIQCSRKEFIEGLKTYRAIQIEGRLRILQYDYEYKIVSFMLDLISENSWKLDEIERDETISALNGIVPTVIVEQIFDLYATKIAENSNKYRYDEEKVCRIIAQNILEQGLMFHVDDFITTWKKSLPEDMNTDEKYLKGIGIIDRETEPPRVRSLIETNLSTNLMERLKVLFKTKEKWTLEQIEPYIEYFTTPQLTISSILAKHARSTTVNGQRQYVAKHL